DVLQPVPALAEDRLGPVPHAARGALDGVPGAATGPADEAAVGVAGHVAAPQLLEEAGPELALDATHRRHREHVLLGRGPDRDIVGARVWRVARDLTTGGERLHSPAAAADAAARAGHRDGGDDSPRACELHAGD